MGVYGIMIGGWASNNKFSLLAAIRGASQIISYELAMGLSLIALLMLTGSLSLKTIVEQQMAPDIVEYCLATPGVSYIPGVVPLPNVTVLHLICRKLKTN